MFVFLFLAGTLCALWLADHLNESLALRYLALRFTPEGEKNSANQKVHRLGLSKAGQQRS